ncbi:hypothetical protein BCR44DRAFT_33553 [Catenaria anguillulae PL171]|uniref:DUF4200 domain-containing protein n=1 Tax=Catenaria anguillulae PL171 TaxID=765915 RepID=A0A1Y2HJH9_9FUNG|nr:hypothetical protein BCR44DRAFT_33553 [Catenaria anguillulae PL171]
MATTAASTLPSLDVKGIGNNVTAKDSANVMIRTNFGQSRDGPRAGSPLEQDRVFLTQQGGKLLEGSKLAAAFDTFASKSASNDNPVRKLARAEVAKDMQSTLLIRRRKELKEVQVQLERKRVEFKKRMDECAEKHDELKAKQRLLRERVQKFEKFLRENDAKRQRALAKALTERKLKEQKEQELAQLHEQLKSAISRSEKIKKLLSTLYQPNERYLTAVIASLPTDYLDVQEPQINDILQRYSTLSETNRDLQQTLQVRLDEIERESNHLNDLLKQKNDRILVYNSQLGALQKRLDRAKAESARVEALVAQTLSSGKERMRTLSETKLAINNIYRIGLVRNSNLSVPTNAPPVVLLPDSSAFSEKLAVIQDRVLDMTQIATKAEQFVREDREKGRFRFRETAPAIAGANGGGGLRVVDFAPQATMGGGHELLSGPPSGGALASGGSSMMRSKSNGVALLSAGGVGGGGGAMSRKHSMVAAFGM